MALIHTFEGRRPIIHPSAFIAPTAVIIGEVTIGPEATVLYGAVLRGDLDPIILGERSNVQDNAVLHTGRGEPCIIGPDVSIGHAAVVHGCTVERGCLIGIMACALNRSIIGEDSVLGAKALVAEGKIIPPRSLVLGVPGKVVRELTEEDLAWSHDITARYVIMGQRHRRMLEEAGGQPPLP